MHGLVSGASGQVANTTLAHARLPTTQALIGARVATNERLVANVIQGKALEASIRLLLAQET